MNSLFWTFGPYFALISIYFLFIIISLIIEIKVQRSKRKNIVKYFSAFQAWTFFEKGPLRSIKVQIAGALA